MMLPYRNKINGELKDAFGCGLIVTEIPRKKRVRIAWLKKMWKEILVWME